MAAGDIIAVEVLGSTDYNGWAAKVTIEGWAGKTALTEAFGLDAEKSPGVNTPYMTVVSEGYTAGVLGTRQRTVYLKEVVRKAYPNHAAQNVADNGADLDVIIALFDPVFNDDKNGGAGTSGTNPTFTAPAAGWLSEGVDNAATASAMAVTNSSALDYPKAIGQLESLPFERVETDFELAFRARHFYGIDCVRFDATGDTSLVNVNDTVTSESSKLWSASGLYTSRHQTTIPLSGFTQGEHITCRVRAYPLIGDADSMIDTQGVTFDARLHGEFKMTCDKTGALKVYAFVSSTGNDTTGVASATEATAEASPCLTIGQAVAKGANVIKVMDARGIVGDDPTTRVTSQYFIKVIPDDGLNITINLDGTGTATRNYKCERILYEGFTIKTTATTGWTDGENLNYIAFRNCTLDANATSLGAPIGHKSLAMWLINCTGLNATRHLFTNLNPSRAAYEIIGCAGVVGGTVDAAYCFVGTLEVGNWLHREKSTTNPGPTWDNCCIESNKALNFATSDWLSISQTLNNSNVSVCGNLVEKTGAGNVVMSIAAGTGTLENLLFGHNTVAGDRVNIGYNASGSVRFERRNFRQLGNSLRDWNHKGDNYAPEDAARTGGWWVEYNVGSKHNHHEISTFPGSADGQDHTEGAPGYTNDQSTSGGGAGNGDYTPAVGSVLRNRMTDRLMRYDLNGLEIFTDGTGAIGALQVAFAPTISDHPDNATKDVGESVTFSVVATGNPSTLTYQWRKDGVNIGGATSADYTIASVAEADAGDYDVVVTNSEGSATSNVATLTVNSATSNWWITGFRRWRRR